jgi:GTP-binding protein YchF
MSLSIGIVGLPNVGKSTMFNAITKKSVPAENYPFCTIDPSVGIVPVPDERIDKLAKLSSSIKTLPAVVEFTDIAGLVKGAAEGEGLGNQFLSHIREVDAICEVVRIFEDSNITHVHGEVNPLSDVMVINYELVLADLATVTKRLSNIQKEVKRNDALAIKEHDALTKVEEALRDGRFANQVELTEDETPFVKHQHLLTSKPIMYALNKKTGGNNLDDNNDPRYRDLIEYIEERGCHYTKLDASSELEINEMSDAEKISFKEEMGIDGGLNELIVKGYEILNLITYFTTGETETRAWTVKRDSTAPQAGAAIHSDFEHKFIRAEVVACADLLECGSYAAAREKGVLRIVGKDYIVQDGDVIEFRV